MEICVPIVYGTMAFHLGRKASEYVFSSLAVFILLVYMSIISAS